MFDNVGPTHPKATDVTESIDDVEGHRVAMFIEDQKDSALGALPTATDDPAPEPGDDVEGHRLLWATGEPEPEDDVEAHMILGVTSLSDPEDGVTDRHARGL